MKDIFIIKWPIFCLDRTSVVLDTYINGENYRDGIFLSGHASKEDIEDGKNYLLERMGKVLTR